MKMVQVQFDKYTDQQQTVVKCNKPTVMREDEKQ